MKNKNGIILLVIIYTVGVLGIIFPATRSLTLSLTPINLLLTLMFLMGFHKNYTFFTFLGFIMVMALGYFLEVVGIATQSLFGPYQYGKTLGPQYWSVPFAMGINWLLLIYTTRIAALKITKNILVISLISATLMVSLDFILEPVAIFMDMWQWKGAIPVQNYVTWFVAGFFIQLFYCNLDKKIQNPIAIPVLIIQFAFFSLIRLYTILG